MAALESHTSVLRDFCQRAFVDGDGRYLGEIAGKLRLLVYDRGTNHPLLLDVADAFEADTTFILDGPPGFQWEKGVSSGDRVDLRNWLQSFAFSALTETNAQVQLSKMDVIVLWAQQTGASHEDPELDERLHVFRNMDVFIGGQSADAAVLRSIALTVLSVAASVLNEIAGRGEVGAPTI